MDTSGIRERLKAHLLKSGAAGAAVKDVAPLAGGASQDIYRVELTLSSEAKVMVLRGDAKHPLEASLDRKREASVALAAVRRGVKTPEPRFLGKDVTREGAYSYLLDFLPGVAIGRRVVRDAALAAARERLVTECAVELAKIHSITPAEGGVDLEPCDDPVGAALRAATAALDSLREPRPAIEIALAWLKQHPPEDRRVCLVHGDFRTGNFLVTERGLEAVLDWEFAHWGCAAEDLAWMCMRNWRFGQNDKAAGGFATRGSLYAAYAKARGEDVRPGDVHFWEVLGNVRWAAGCAQQGERYLSGGESDLELIAIPRRAPEMEFEALRLIERGPK